MFRRTLCLGTVTLLTSVLMTLLTSVLMTLLTSILMTLPTGVLAGSVLSEANDFFRSLLAMALW